MYIESVKQVVILCCLSIMSSFLFGQNVSITMDSLTQSYSGRLPKSKRVKFDSLLKHRKTIDLYSRIDTIIYDFVFIQETYNDLDSSVFVTERYFNKKDSIPTHVYFNSRFSAPKKIYDGFLIWYSKNVTINYTLDPLIETYSMLKSKQKLNYDRRQIWRHGCVYIGSKESFTKSKKIELKSTYQIMTMVDKVNNKIEVSVQTAPRNPTFETYSYNSVWDW